MKCRRYAVALMNLATHTRREGSRKKRACSMVTNSSTSEGRLINVVSSHRANSCPLSMTVGGRPEDSMLPTGGDCNASSLSKRKTPHHLSAQDGTHLHSIRSRWYTALNVDSAPFSCMSVNVEANTTPGCGGAGAKARLGLSGAGDIGSGGR